MDIFLKSPWLNKQSNVVVYVERLDLAGVKWVGFFPQPSLFSHEHSYLSGKLNFSFSTMPRESRVNRKHRNYLKAKCPGPGI